MDERDLSHIRILLTHLGFSDATLSIEKSNDTPLVDGVTIHIRHTTPQLLIGPGGEHLRALEHIVRCILHRCASPPHRVMVDVNGYRKTRRTFLQYVAHTTAEQVQLFQKAISLEAMNRAERRIIHLVLTDNPGVSTESIGEEPYRRVVVKPAGRDSDPRKSIIN